MAEPTEVVECQLDAYNAHDTERFLSCYAPTIVITNSTGEVLAEGRDQLRAMYGPLFDASPELSASITNRMAIGNFVADHEQVEGFNRGGFSTTFQAIAVYEVTGDFISRVSLFF